MKKTTLKMAIVSLLAAIIACAPSQGLAQEKKKEKAAAAEKKATLAGEKPVPFTGKVTAIDKIAKTVKVGERTFQITSETRIMKGGKPATLDEGAVGDEIGGRFKKSEGGKLTALMVRFGPKPGSDAKGEKPEKKKTKA